MDDLNNTNNYGSNSLPKKKILGLLTVIFLSLGLVLALTLVRQRQEIRKKAVFGTIAIDFRPSDSSLNNVGIGGTYSTEIHLTTGSNKISGVDLSLFFDPQKMELDIVRNNNAFPYPIANWPNPPGDQPSNTEIVKKIDNAAGEARFVFVNRGNSLLNGDVLVATLILKRKIVGEAKLYFYDYTATTPNPVYEVTGETFGDDKDLTISNITTVNFTFSPFGAVTTTPRPTNTPNPSTTPTVTPRPTNTPTSSPIPTLTLTPVPTTSPGLREKRDVDGSGRVDTGDIVEVIKQPFPCVLENPGGPNQLCNPLNANRDINGDKRVDTDDLSQIIKLPFPCVLGAGSGPNPTCAQ